MSEKTATIDPWLPSGDPVLLPKHEQFLDELARRLGRPLWATSGQRTPERQARAMLRKVELGEDLRKLYNDALVEELYAVPRTLEDWTAVIESQIERGFYLSDHLRDDAVDIDDLDRNGQPLDQDAVRAAARDMGVEVVFESTPSHIHFEEIPDV